MRQNMHKNDDTGLQEKSDDELTRLKKALDTQLVCLKMAGLELPSDLLRAFELVQNELTKRDIRRS